MELNGELFSPTFRWWAAGLYGLSLYYAFRLAPWTRLRHSEQLHAFLGACLVLMLLWSLRVTVIQGLVFHFLGVTALTLMFGWSLAMFGASLALLGVTLNGMAQWSSFPVNIITLGILPISLTQTILVLVRSLLPKNFFIYILVNAFLTGGLVATLSGYLASGLLLLSGAHTSEAIGSTFLPFFPLMFLPEGMLNGWIMTVLVCNRPQWVGSFDDDLYLRGK